MWMGSRIKITGLLSLAGAAIADQERDDVLALARWMKAVEICQFGLCSARA
jgi:hypothetical protein